MIKRIDLYLEKDGYYLVVEITNLSIKVPVRYIELSYDNSNSVRAGCDRCELHYMCHNYTTGAIHKSNISDVCPAWFNCYWESDIKQEDRNYSVSVMKNVVRDRGIVKKKKIRREKERN